jgi:hemerythrin-like domain-containing protein
MSGQSEANVALSLITIHKVITRGLVVCREKSREFIQDGFPDETSIDGFQNYIKAFVSVLHSHHMLEDELVFPYFYNKITETPFNLLIEQHKDMVVILDEIQSALENIENQEGLEDLNRAVFRLNEKWHPHIQIEETYFNLERVGDMFPAEVHIQLIKDYSEYSQQHSGPPYLTLPFVLFNLPHDMREQMSKGMPSEVTNNLIPVVWKEQWASMRPFLLD